MSMTVTIILFFLGFVLAIVIGQKCKINPGFLAIGFGFILNWICGGTTNAFINQFPIKMFWNYGIPIIFYGFAAANGTLTTFSKKVAYRFKNIRWAMPIVIIIIAAFIGGCGAGTASTLILAPIAWGLCMSCGTHPLLVPMALWSGSMFGAFLPWTSTGSLNIAAWGTFLTTIDPMGMWWKDYTYKLFYAFVPFTIAFIVLKGWRVKDEGEFIMEEPPAFTKAQKITLGTIIGLIVILFIPSIINTFAPNAVVKWMASNLALPATAVLGISVLSLTKAADIKEVFSKHVSWNLLWIITGMAMYCTLSTSLGIVDAAGKALEGVSGNLVLGAMCAIGAGLSFVTSAATVGPMLTAMVPALAIATGLSQATICLASCIGAGVTSISPYSTGGASGLIGCPDKYAEKMTTSLILLAVAYAVFAVIVCATGLVKFI